MRRLSLAVVILALCATPSSADVVVSNLTNAPAAFPAGIVLFGSQTDGVFTSVAQAFTTGSGGSLDAVTLQMANGTATGSFSLALYSDLAGAPDTPVVNFSGDMTPITAGQYVYAPVVPFGLATMTTYWVVAEPVAGSLGWSTTEDTSETGAPGWTLGNAWQQRQVVVIGGSQVSGGGWTAATMPTQMSVSVTAVPEVSSIALIGLVVALSGSAAILQRRRQSTRSPE